MTKKASSAIRALSAQEIKDSIIGIRTELAKELAMKSSGTRPENPGKIKKMKKNIARHMTIAKEKENTEAKKENQEKPGAKKQKKEEEKKNE